MSGERILVVDDCETIREVVGDILSGAGFRPLLAEDGETGITMAQADTPDLVLVDFIMPKMNGLRFCQVFRNIENLKSIPIILMSVKAESVGDKFMQLVDVVDTITKPFTPESLLAVVSHRIRGAPKEEQIFKAAPESFMEIPISPREESAEAVKAIRTKLCEGLTARLKNSGKAGLERSIMRLCDETFTEAFLKGLTHEFRKVNPLEGVAAFAGSANAISVGDVLQVLYQSNRSGMVEVSDENKRAAIFFRGGKISFARLWGGSEEFLLGRYLLKEELISREALDQVTKQKSAKVLLGERLVKTGLISREELGKALEEQTTEVIYEILRWDNSIYTFHPDVESPEAKTSILGLGAGELLMEGYRRVDEWRLIEKEVQDFDIVVAKTG
ncbi:MAG: DUF4388 domain-containing protein, partial [Pseudomonadota bacterium]